MGGRTALIQASLKQHTALVVRLLAAGASRQKQDRSGKSAFDYAVQKGNDALAATLSPYTCNDGYEPKKGDDLLLCCSKNMPLAAAALLEANANMHTRAPPLGATPLHYAYGHQMTAIIDALLAKQADANAMDSRGCRPVYYYYRCPAEVCGQQCSPLRGAFESRCEI